METELKILKSSRGLGDFNLGLGCNTVDRTVDDGDGKRSQRLCLQAPAMVLYKHNPKPTLYPSLTYPLPTLNLPYINPEASSEHHGLAGTIASEAHNFS